MRPRSHATDALDRVQSDREFDMRVLRQFLLIGLAGLPLLGLLSRSRAQAQAQPQPQPQPQAQDVGATPTTTRSADRDGRVVLSDQQATDSGLNLANTVDRQKLPPEIKERIRRFEII